MLFKNRFVNANKVLLKSFNLISLFLFIPSPLCCESCEQKKFGNIQVCSQGLLLFQNGGADSQIAEHTSLIKICKKQVHFDCTLPCPSKDLVHLVVPQKAKQSDKRRYFAEATIFIKNDIKCMYPTPNHARLYEVQKPSLLCGLSLTRRLDISRYWRPSYFINNYSFIDACKLY